LSSASTIIDYPPTTRYNNNGTTNQASASVYRTKKRYQVCKPVFEKYSHSVIDIIAKGNSKLEQFLYLIHIGDWISCYIADNRGIDPVEVNIIDYLKGELAKF
jgi:glucose/mannose-6-phosphate isomerase